MHVGDCRTVLPLMAENSVDALVTDPPAGPVLTDIERSGIGNYQMYAGGLSKGAPRLGAHKGNVAEHRRARDRFVAFATECFTAVCRVLKPGGFGLVWATPKTSHWTSLALDESGLEVRDVISHVYPGARSRSTAKADVPPSIAGWNTALPQTLDHWILVRKPPIGPLLANHARYGTGALNLPQWKDGANTIHAERATRAERYGYCAACGTVVIAAAHRDHEVLTHPTPKGILLMRALVRLVTPSGGIVLDPFAGAGATGVACLRESVRFVGIEAVQTYAMIMQHRLQMEVSHA